MPVHNIKQPLCNTASPLISKTLPTMSAYTAIATKMNYHRFLAMRTIIRAIPVPITLANKHLFHFNNLNTPNLTAMIKLVDIPVTIVREDTIDSYWLANNCCFSVL